VATRGATSGPSNTRTRGGGQDPNAGIDSGRERPRLRVRPGLLLEQERVGSGRGRLGGGGEPAEPPPITSTSQWRFHDLARGVILVARDDAEAASSG